MPYNAVYTKAFLVRVSRNYCEKMGGSSSKEDGGVKANTKEFVEKSIKDDKVVVFIKPTCPFCARIKKLFGDLGAPIHIVDITKRQDTSEIQDYLQYKCGARTVGWSPCSFI